MIPEKPEALLWMDVETTGLDVSIRVKGIRESVERIRDQVAMMPLGGTRDRTQSDLVALERRLFDITERAKRGADVGGFLREAVRASLAEYRA